MPNVITLIGGMVTIPSHWFIIIIVHSMSDYCSSAPVPLAECHPIAVRTLTYFNLSPQVSQVQSKCSEAAAAYRVHIAFQLSRMTRMVS